MSEDKNKKGDATSTEIKKDSVKKDDTAKITQAQLDAILKQNEDLVSRITKMEDDKKTEDLVASGKDVLVNMIVVRLIDGEIVTGSEFVELKTEKDEMNQDRTVQYRKYIYGDKSNKVLSGKEYRTTTETKELELVSVVDGKNGKYVIATDENDKEYKIDYEIVNI